MFNSDLRGLGITDSPGPSLELPRLQRHHNDINNDPVIESATEVKEDQYQVTDEIRGLSQSPPETETKSVSNSDLGDHIHYMVEKGLLDASLENLLSLHNPSTIRTAKLIKVGDSSQDSSGTCSTLGSWGGSASGCDLYTALNTGKTMSAAANTDIPSQQHNMSSDFLSGSMEFIEDMSMPSFCESVELVSLDRTVDESPMKVNKMSSVMEISDSKGSSTKSVTFEDHIPASPCTPLTSTSLLDLGDALASSPKIAACTNLIQEGTKSSYLSPKQIIDAKKRSWTEASLASGVFAEAGKIVKELDYVNISGSGISLDMHHLVPAYSPPLNGTSPMHSTASPRTPFDHSLELLDLENVDDSLLQMSPIELESFVEAGPPLLTRKTLPDVALQINKVTRTWSHQDDHLQEFSSIPAHELLLRDQQMPDFDPTRGSILAFKEQIPERSSNESKKKDDKSTSETIMGSTGTMASRDSNPINRTLELKKSAEKEESTTQTNVSKFEREDTMDLLCGLSSQSQKMKTLLGFGKTEEIKKLPEEVFNQTFEEPLPLESKQLNGTFDNYKDTAAVSSNLNVTIVQPNSKVVVAAGAVLNGTFDQENLSVELNLNDTIEEPKKLCKMNGTFSQPEFEKYCNLDLAFDQPDLLKAKQESNQNKADVLNGTFVQSEPLKQNQLNGTFDQPESKDLNGTFDQPESKNAFALNNTFDQKFTNKAAAAALNGTFDNPITENQGNLNETFDEVPKTTLDCTFEATETIPKGLIVTTGLDGTYDHGDSECSNETFDSISDTKPDTNDSFEHHKEKNVEDLNSTNLMDCGREALQKFINLGTPSKGKLVVSSTPKPVAKEAPVPNTQSTGSNEEAKTNEASTATQLTINGPKLGDLSRESAATTLRMKQKSLVERSSKAAVGPVKALPFLPTTQTDVEPQHNSVEGDTMDVDPSGEAEASERRITYNVPCDPSSPLGQFRKKQGIIVSSSMGSVTDSFIEEANKIATDIRPSISMLKLEDTVDLLEGITVIKDHSDGSTSSGEDKLTSRNRKLRELRIIQDDQGDQDDYDLNDEVFSAPHDEAFASSGEIESQKDTQNASTDSAKSDISVKSSSSVIQSKLGKPKMKGPQSLPKARTGSLPPTNKRSSLQPKKNLQGPLGLNKGLPNQGKTSGMGKTTATGIAINKLASTLPAQLDGNKIKRVSLAPNKISKPKNVIESTMKPPAAPKNKNQSKISPPLQRKSLAPTKSVAPKSSTVNTRQSLAPKSLSTRQSLAPKATTEGSRQSLAPKLEPTRQSLAPKATTAASRQSLAPKTQSTRQSLAPKATTAALRQSLAPKPPASKQSLAPNSQADKPNINARQSLAPKPVTAKPTLPTTRQSLAPKALAGSGVNRPSERELKPKPDTKSLQKQGSPKGSSASPKNSVLKKSPSKQSPRKSNEENKESEIKFGELKKQSGLIRPTGLVKPSGLIKPSGLVKPPSRLPMKAGVLEDTTNILPSAAAAAVKGTGLSRLAALKQPGFGLNNGIDKKQVSKLVRKSSCLDTSLSNENDVPAAKFPKLAKLSKEPAAENLKIKKNIPSPFSGSTNNVDSERPCTPDMPNLPVVNNYSETPDFSRPGSEGMFTSTPAMGSGYIGRINCMEEDMTLPTPIAAVSRLRFTSDNSTPSSINSGI